MRSRTTSNNTSPRHNCKGGDDGFSRPFLLGHCRWGKVTQRQEFSSSQRTISHPIGIPNVARSLAHRIQCVGSQATAQALYGSKQHFRRIPGPGKRVVIAVEGFDPEHGQLIQLRIQQHAFQPFLMCFGHVSHQFFRIVNMVKVHAGRSQGNLDAGFQFGLGIHRASLGPIVAESSFQILADCLGA